VVVIPYVMPGFDLARLCQPLEMAQQRPRLGFARR
jgi:rhamnose utilization protein RhaD (predicted bifunctional aldolase and dehydrogenase)